MSQLLHQYKNGNTNVSIMNDGTKIRTFHDQNPWFEFPESMDVKITNYCDLSHICTFCHEMSDTIGKHADLGKLLEVISCLPKGIELAIGGGNPLSHPLLDFFLERASQKGFLCNLTVNQLHVKRHRAFIDDIIKRDLIKGIGLSYRTSKLTDSFKSLASYEHTVIHMICGVDPWEDMKILMDAGFKKFLLLGYKKFGNGVDFFDKFPEQVEKNIHQWYMYLPKYLAKDGITISFDNLAIEQLNVKRFFLDEGWERFFLGEDGSHSMYIDAIEQKYAKTSREEQSKRVSFSTMGLKEYFQKMTNGTFAQH